MDGLSLHITYILSDLSNNNMRLTADNKFKKIIIVGDRVLIKLKKADEKTSSGLYLPPGVKEKEQVQHGYIIKTGPGYPIPIHAEENEPWKKQEDKVSYIPLQAKEGDLAVFLSTGAHEVIYEGEKFYIVSQHAILMLEREEEL